MLVSTSVLPYVNCVRMASLIMGVTHVLTSHARTAWASQALTVIDGAASDPDGLRMVAWERGREKEAREGVVRDPAFGAIPQS